MTSGSALFEEIERHLLSDEKPSRFLSELAGSPVLRQYPFNMLERLRNTPQSPRYHPEGSVWNHTLLVVDEAAENRNKSADPRSFMWAALLHDIGALSFDDRLDLIEEGARTSKFHAYIGADLLSDFEPLRQVAEVIRYHHVPWEIGRAHV